MKAGAVDIANLAVYNAIDSTNYLRKDRMGIKNLFNELRVIGKKKYYFRNGDEELIFSRDNFSVEIIQVNGNLDIIISHNNIRANYLHSESLSNVEKMQIKMILGSCYSLELKSKEISQILLNAFFLTLD